MSIVYQVKTSCFLSTHQDSDTIIDKLGGFLSETDEIVVDDAARIVGCWKALSKQGIHADVDEDTAPMQRALAFCQVIEKTEKARTHQVSSTHIAGIFEKVVEAYQTAEQNDGNEISHHLVCEAKHVDGGMGAGLKEEKLNWLKATPEPVLDENGEARPVCRILSNVRCLSEGVDVPSLDSVLFLTPRSSQVDVVQSVGRVMRLAPNKKRGYVILPVVIPPGMEPHKALDDNKTYKVVWQVLNALRSHDDRFDAMINKMDLTGIDKSKMEVIAITNKVTAKAKKKAAGQGGATIGTATKKTKTDKVEDTQQTFSFESGEIERAIVAKVVQKVGNRHHWEDWANDISKIAQTHIKLITEILQRPECDKERAVFEEFAIEIRDDLNNAVSDAEIIEMLAQHLITKPVFDALFDEYSFAKHNPMAVAMQKVLDVLDQHQIDSETQALERFYESVKMRAAGIDSAEGKQKIIVELYDKFFRNAFPRMTERLGIVYTPVEVVDFILHSVNDVLKQEFGKSIADKGVHVIDPFTGTGTFITRLIQSGLIPQDKLVYKYKNELHANELVLLAYYIAAINIEAVYHSYIIDDYTPFEGICLTDTFQMYEKEDLVDQVLVDNSARRKRQKELDIQVIIGNPPYSAGQDSANDNNANVKYPSLDEKIRQTYADKSNATLKNALYDSYIRAIRWASDRIETQGVIGFVTNAGFVDANTADGLRKCLAEEFSSLYIFHLRGNQRTSGEKSRQEGGKIFGSGSRAPIAISILVKNPNVEKQGQIYFHDIGDYLSREEKLEKVANFKSLQGIAAVNGWTTITPDEHGDWLNQRDDSFCDFISVGDKRDKTSVSLTNEYSNGVKTNRDAWCYNSSKANLINKIGEMTEFYNSEVMRFYNSDKSLEAKDFVLLDSTRINWTREVFNDVKKKYLHKVDHKDFVVSLYRPFTKQHMYFNRHFNNCVYKIPAFFPNSTVKNLVISFTGLGTPKEFSCLISNYIPDVQLHANGQHLALYLYEEITQEKSIGSGDLFDNSLDLTVSETKYQRKDGISDEGLVHFQTAYPNEQISKEDIFYYTYGLLHNEEYRERYADNLTKELPRIPCVKKAEDFWAFSKAGRDLAHWHLNYETVEKYKATLDTGSTAYNQLTDEDFYVEKMKFAKKGEKGTVIYNKRITVKDIPVEAYEYVVNGKPALEWVMERQGVSTHKDSGIVNDANNWAIETMGNPAYPLELFLRVITVSLETMKIVKGLPKLDI